MSLTIPFALDPDPPSADAKTGGSVVQRGRRAREAAALLAPYGRLDDAATEALDHGAVEAELRSLTGRPDDVLEGASVRATLAGSGSVIVAKASRASDGRSFLAALETS